MAGAESLIFRSQSHLFALPSTAVAGISKQSDLAGVSFSKYFFHVPEVEPHQIVLAEGFVLFVGEVLEISILPEEVLPVPGYIFESDPEWLRGVLWHEDKPVLLLNDRFLTTQLAEYVPELPV